MSARFPFPTKLNPLWWAANADDPPPRGYSALSWWFRNPFHNFMWYVLGCKDRPFKIFGRPVNFADKGLHGHVLIQKWPPFICPFISYKSSRFEFYLGWRYDGPFGARLTFK